jgi:WD40 repeat protein
MMKRRNFLASLTATCVAGPLTIHYSHATAAAPRAPFGKRLNWDCDVIETVSHRSDRRKPVVTGVDVESTGRLMAVVGDDHAIGIYDFQDQSFVQHLDKHTDWVRAARFSRDGRLLATAGNDRQLFVWDSNDLGPGRAAPVQANRTPEAIIDLTFNHNGSLLATVGFDGWLRLFDTQTGLPSSKLACACPDNHAVAFSADGQQVAAGGRSGTIRGWDVDSGDRIAQYKVHRQRVRTLEFASDGRLVSGGDDQRIAITDPKNPSDGQRLPRQASKLYAVKLLDNDLIATGGSDNKIHVSRLLDGSDVGYLEGHTGTVSSLALKSDQLVSGSYDTQVRIWSTTRQASVLNDARPVLNTSWKK